MLLPFVVVYKLKKDQNLLAHAIAAPSSDEAVEAIFNLVSSQGHSDAFIVGAFSEEDIVGLGQLIDNLKDALANRQLANPEND